MRKVNTVTTSSPYSPLVKITAHLCIQVASTADDPKYFSTNLGLKVRAWKYLQREGTWEQQTESRMELLKALQGLGLTASESNEVHELLCVNYNIPPF